MRMSHYTKDEQGNILIIFAFTFVFIMLLVGFATDVGLMYCKRAHLLEIGQIARNARFNEEDYIVNSDYPADAFHDIVVRSVVKNGIEPSQVRTKFEETTYTGTVRSYKVDIYIEDTYECTFMRIFGADKCKVSVHIPGYGTLNSSNGIWKPGY